MTKQPRPWVKDVLVFAVATLVSLVLTCGGPPLAERLDASGCPRLVAEAVPFVFITPAWVARELGVEDLILVLIALNPLLYGLMWWGAWRIVKLLRTKPAA